MELEIGSNIIRDTNGILIVEGEQQLESGVREDGQAPLTMDVYDADGKHIAKLNRNAWAFNDEERFAITTHPASLRIIDQSSDEVVVEVNVISRTQVRVPRGHFFTHLGHAVTITPGALRIMGITISRSMFEGGNQALAIGPGSLGIGS